MKFSAFLCMVGMAFSTPLDMIETRIYGGTRVLAGDVKFMVGLESGGKPLCSGVLINKNTVLTGAQCGAGVPRQGIHVRVGSQKRLSGGQLIKGIKERIPHLYFNNGLKNDIAILKLKNNITETSQIKPIQLYSGTSVQNIDVTVAGWGSTQSSNENVVSDLYKVTTHVMFDIVCQRTLGANFDSSRMFCAGGPAGACKADYGGPAYITENGVDMLIGIVMRNNKCSASTPGFYTEISAFKSWIETIINLKPKIFK